MQEGYAYAYTSFRSGRRSSDVKLAEQAAKTAGKAYGPGDVRWGKKWLSSPIQLCLDPLAFRCRFGGCTLATAWTLFGLFVRPTSSSLCLSDRLWHRAWLRRGAVVGEWASSRVPLLGIVFYVAVYLLLVARRIRARRQAMFVARLQLPAIRSSSPASCSHPVDRPQAFCYWCLLSPSRPSRNRRRGFIFERPWDGRIGHETSLGILFASLLGSIVVSSIGLCFCPVRSPAEVPALRSPRWRVVPAVDPGDDEADLARGHGERGRRVEYGGRGGIPRPRCPACRRFHPTMKAIRDAYKDRVTFAVRMFPVGRNPIRMPGAAIGFVCAERQGAGLRLGVGRCRARTSLSAPTSWATPGSSASTPKAFEACLDEPAAAPGRGRRAQAGEALGVASTPTLFVNDVMMRGTPMKKTFGDSSTKRLPRIPRSRKRKTPFGAFLAAFSRMISRYRRALGRGVRAWVAWSTATAKCRMNPSAHSKLSSRLQWK